MVGIEHDHRFDEVADVVDPLQAGVRLPPCLPHNAGNALNDVLQALVKAFADALMSAEADALCGAGYGERSAERTNSRNGYR